MVETAMRAARSAGKAVNARGDGGKRDRTKFVILGERQGVAVGAGEQGVLVGVAAPPDRPNGVDDMARRKLVAPGDLGFASWTAAEAAALGKQFGAGGAMDGAVDAAAAQQRLGWRR